VNTDLGGEGTPEDAWQQWPELAARPKLRVTSPPATAVVVAPHPDDEILGVGGLLSLLARAGTEIHIVAVTDGEASHPGSPTLTPHELAARRIRESMQAQEILGLSAASVQRLRLPDGGVRQAEAYAGTITAAVMHALARTADRGEAWCIAPWSGDGHPDHAAAGAAAITAAGVTARILAYPVWMWHWAEPEDARVPWWQARRIALPDDVRDAKRAAAAAFTTQVSPLSDDPADAAILPPNVLIRLTRDVEFVFEVDPR
jgi:LmbE family N-acetylglucosaminyl deacetylase